MHLNQLGEIVKEEIANTEKLRKNVIVDSWVVMPNHVHLIIFIVADDNVGTPRRGVPTEDNRCWKPGCLGEIINHLKGACTRRIRANLNPAFAWQPRFYDHILRGEHDLANLRSYISYNPENWQHDDQPFIMEAAIHA